jgi:predicted O-methyltransferase YrrM
MKNISRLVIDSSDAKTTLCQIGQTVGTDKSPSNIVSHRHPYTAVYTMLFAGLKNKPLTFAEIGVAGGRSALLWEEYFTHPNAKIHMFDSDENFLNNARRMVGNRFVFSKMDVSIDGDITRALGQEMYDIFIDDSSHNFEHQIRIIKEAWACIKPGGMLIVEDIFRKESEEKYAFEIFKTGIFKTCSSAYFVVCEHTYRWSPDWDNDKLLVLVKE